MNEWKGDIYNGKFSVCDCQWAKFRSPNISQLHRRGYIDRFFLFLNVTLLHTADFFFRSGHRWDIIAVSIVILPSFVVILLGFRIHVPKGTYRSGSLFILIYLLLFTHASNTLAFFATRSSLILYITKYTSIMSYRDLRSM